MKRIKPVLCLFLAGAFFAAMIFFRRTFLTWENPTLTFWLFLIAVASLTCVVIFSVTEKVGLKPLKVFLFCAIVFIGLAGIMWGLLTVLNLDGKSNRKAVYTVFTLLCGLFLTALIIYYVFSFKRGARVYKILTAVVILCVFFVGAAYPFIEEPGLGWLNRGLQQPFRLTNNYVFSIHADDTGAVLPNVKSNINCVGGRFGKKPLDTATTYNPYDFIEYVQLMECTGGNDERDLFVHSDDFTVLDDYDFSGLISSCENILETGAKPLLKLGNVPAKLSRKTITSKNIDLGEFNVNVYPPDDYGEYYTYIKAIAGALVDHFGREEVLSWRFGVLTEYENDQWFHDADNNADNTMIEYCKLYDYTVQALIDVIGQDVFVGAHSMTCGKGMWDEADFIRHCGEGTNYATGRKGTRIKYLAASYYERKPGLTGDPESLTAITGFFRETARSVGLTDLIFGVDEGRILCGVHDGSPDSSEVSALIGSRTVGYTY